MRYALCFPLTDFATKSVSFVDNQSHRHRWENWFVTQSIIDFCFIVRGTSTENSKASPSWKIQKIHLLVLPYAVVSGALGYIDSYVDSSCGFSRNIIKQWWISLLTALHLASECGSEGCVTLLLTSGADPNLQDHMLQTPLMAACITGHTSCIHPVCIIISN